MRRLLLASTLLCLGAAAPEPAPSVAAAPAPAPASPKASVAVLYFDDQTNTPELAVLRKGLAQMLITDLVAAGGFDVVERARLQEVLDELELGRTNKIDPATANKVGKILCASHMVIGSYIEFPGGTFVLNAQVLNVEINKHVHSIRVAGKKDDFLEMEQKVATDFAPYLAKLVPPSAAPGTKTGAARPAKAKAAPGKLAIGTAVRFSKALDALDRKDKAAAKKELEAVVEEQPDFTLAANELAALML